MSIIADSIASIGLTKGPFSMAAAGYLARQDAPSGMHRLMLYKLQEEHLQKEAEKKVISQAAKEVAEKVAAVKPKKKQKLEPLVPLEKYEKPRFKRRHIQPQSTGIDEEVAANLKIWSAEIDSWLIRFSYLLQAQRQVIIIEQEAAANDADYRLRLLLLAA